MRFATMRPSRRRVFAVLGGGIAAVAGAARPGSAAPVATDDAVRAAVARLPDLAREALARDAAPGVAIAVVHRDQVVVLEGFGVREAGAGAPVGPDTVFQLASLSKPISSTVVAGLVSDGAATWDDRVVDRLPGFQLSNPWVTRNVTIRDFFCHRSGLSGATGDDLETLGFDLPTVITRLRYASPTGSFRMAYAYSNCELTVGAVAAAAPTGRPWADVAAERLYQPLGMTATSSRYADFLARPDRAKLHIREDGAWVARFTRNADVQSPAGGISSSVRDLAQWLRLHLAQGEFNGQRLIAADALAVTKAPHIALGPHPLTGAAAFYGLGWGVTYDDQGSVFTGHAGAFSLGARTVVTLLPAQDLGIVVLANAFPTGLPEALSASFYDLVLTGGLTRDWLPIWNQLYAHLAASFGTSAARYAAPPAAPLAARPASVYRGRYANDFFGELVVAERDGGLTLSLGPNGTTVFALRHFDGDVFTYVPDPEPPAAPFGAMFAVGPDQRAWQVALEHVDDHGQGRFARVDA